MGWKRGWGWAGRETSTIVRMQEDEGLGGVVERGVVTWSRLLNGWWGKEGTLAFAWATQIIPLRTKTLCLDSTGT